MTVVRVISALGCRPCEHVKARLERIAQRHPDLKVEYVDMLTDEGIALSARHRVWTLPTLIVGDAVVGEGDIDAAELEQLLALLPAGS